VHSLASVPESNEGAEVQRTDEPLIKYASHYNKLFEEEDIEKVEAGGYTVIGGDVEAGDGFQKSAVKIAANVLGHVRPGSIVIPHMHGGPNAPDIFPKSLQPHSLNICCLRSMGVKKFGI
jgi:hypothetical protein